MNGPCIVGPGDLGEPSPVLQASTVERLIEKFGRTDPSRPESLRDVEDPREGSERFVLVVDDDSDCRESLQILLESHGIRVRTAVNGHQALERIRSGPIPCLILLDNLMPVMTGEEFLAARKLDPEIASVPVLMVSAWDYFRGKDRELNVQGFAKKPYDPEALVGMVRRYWNEPAH